MSKLRLAFLGFRHGHIMGLYKSARQHPRVEVVAACEEDAEAAQALRAANEVELTHKTFDEVFEKVQFDAVAVGDFFGRRGSVIIRALEAGKHVIADKPICTRFVEFESIAYLVRENNLRVGCLLDLRDHGPFLAMRRHIQSGAVGPVHTVAFSAQHPLLLGKRAKWYFEEGKHGGTINDIGVHAVDLIPWLTGRKIVECVAAREWRARAPISQFFNDAGQVMLKLDNGGGVLGDVSYLTPDGVGYSPPQYWRVLVHGEAGAIETSYNAKKVDLYQSSASELPIDESKPTGCLDAFLDDIFGSWAHGHTLNTNDVLDAAAKSLLIQQAADRDLSQVALKY